MTARAGVVVLRPADSMGLKSVTAGGADVTDGFDLTRAMTVDVHLTSQVSVLEGVVKPSDGVIAGDCNVVVFAVEPTHWRTPLSRRVVTVRCGDNGKFRGPVCPRASISPQCRRISIAACGPIRIDWSGCACLRRRSQ